MSELELNKQITTQICQDLKLDMKHILNIYLWGSRSYGGIHRPDSDYDLIMITDHPDPPLEFEPGHIKNHHFELIKDTDGKYDIIFYSLDNFKLLLDRNLIYAIECIFLPIHCLIKNTVDLRDYYMKTAFNYKLLRNYTHYETDMQLQISKKNWSLDREFAKKKLFHSLRYWLFGYQILKDKQVTDFSQGNHYYWQIQALPDNLTKQEMVAYFRLEREKLRQLVDNYYYSQVIDIRGTFQFELFNEKTGEIMTITSPSKSHYPENLAELPSENYLKLVRILARINNSGLPQTAELQRPEHYFLFVYHFQINKDMLPNLVKFCQNNKLVLTELNQLNYQINLKCFKTGKTLALEQAGKLKKQLKSLQAKISDLEKWYVIYDYPPKIDQE